MNSSRASLGLGVDLQIVVVAVVAPLHVPDRPSLPSETCTQPLVMNVSSSSVGILGQHVFVQSDRGVGASPYARVQSERIWL